MVVICAIAIVAFVIFRPRDRKNFPANSGSIPNVAVARVSREDLAEHLAVEAEFRPFQEIDLHANVAGFVKSMNVDIGDRVQAGQLLATLEVPELKEDLERAEAQALRSEKETNRAAATYEDAHLAFTRLTTVNQSRPNLIAQQDLDTAQARDRVGEAALSVARQEVAVSRAEVNKLRAMADYCKVTAPFAGVITKRYADEGSLIQGGVSPTSAAMPLVRLSQNDRLRLVFPVSVPYVGHINIGDPVEIRIAALGKTISGKISRFARKVESATRTMETEVDVPNANLALTPGIYAIANLKLNHREKVLTIPAGAISNHKAPTVFVLNHDNEIVERPVKLGLETPDKFEVLDGLQENELVMLGSRAQVKPGQKVEPRISATETTPTASE